MGLFGRKKRTEPSAAPASGPTNHLTDGLVSPLDVIAPDAIDRSSLTHLKVGPYTARTMAVTGLPAEVGIGWLSPITEFPGDLDMSIQVKTFSEVEGIEELTRLRTKLDAAKMLQRGNISIIAELDRAAEDIWAIREMVSQNRAKLYKATILSTLYHPKQEELDSQADRLESKLAGRRIHVRYADGRQDEAFKSVVPIGLNFMGDIYRTLDSYALSTTFPFISGDLVMEGGYPLGINLSTLAPVFLNLFSTKLRNHNMAIYSGSGQGKSTTVKVMIGRGLCIGERFVVLDPEGEFKRLAERFGGVLVRVAPGSPDRINPMEVRAEEDPDSHEWVVRLVDKVLDVSSLVMTMCGGNLKPEEATVLEEAIRAVYAKRGITTDPTSLYEDGRFAPGRRDGLKRMPRLKDVYEELCKRGEAAARLAQILPRFVEGGTLDLFDCESTVAIDDQSLVVFDMSALEEGLARPIAMQVVLGWTWEQFAKKNLQDRKRIVVDEAWMFTRYPAMLDFLERCVRRIRKRTGGLTVISQDFRVFNETAQGKAIQTNTDSFLFLAQTDSDIDDFTEMFKLSAGEREFLLTAGKGEGILRVSGQPVAIKIVLTADEYQWATTTPLANAAGGGQ